MRERRTVPIGQRSGGRRVLAVRPVAAARFGGAAACARPLHRLDSRDPRLFETAPALVREQPAKTPKAGATGRKTFESAKAQKRLELAANRWPDATTSNVT